MRTFGILLIVLLIAAGGYLLWRNHTLEREVVQLQKELAGLQESDITIYLVKDTPTDFVLTPVARKVSGPATPLKALELLIEGPKPDEGLRPAISPRTRVESLTVEEGLATVSFSKALREDYIGGSQNESNLVQAIVHTLTQFPQIQQVQILIEEEMVETIGGHVAIDRPLAGK